MENANHVPHEYTDINVNLDELPINENNALACLNKFYMQIVVVKWN